MAAKAQQANGGIVPLATTGAAQVGAFLGTAAISEGAGAAVEQFAMDGKALHPAARGAISAGTGIALGAAALASKKTRKYAGAVVGGGFLKAVFDVAKPFTEWVAGKVRGMLKKEPAAGVDGTNGVARVRNNDVVQNGRARDLVN